MWCKDYVNVWQRVHACAEKRVSKQSRGMAYDTSYHISRHDCCLDGVLTAAGGLAIPRQHDAPHERTPDTAEALNTSWT